MNLMESLAASDSNAVPLIFTLSTHFSDQVSSQHLSPPVTFLKTFLALNFCCKNSIISLLFIFLTCQLTAILSS
jgi:hypothetical protein